MNFESSTEVTILFDAWHTDTSWKYALSLLGLLLISFFNQYLVFLTRRCNARRTAPQLTWVTSSLSLSPSPSFPCFPLCCLPLFPSSLTCSWCCVDVGPSLPQEGPYCPLLRGAGIRVRLAMHA